MESYDSILKEIESAQDKSIINITSVNDSKEDKNIKFISGGFLFWVVSIFVLFAKNKQVMPRIKKIINNFVSHDIIKVSCDFFMQKLFKSHIFCHNNNRRLIYQPKINLLIKYQIGI